MALIPCPECGAQISDAATSCPQCGAPLLKPAATQPISPAPAPEPVIAPAPASAPAPAPVRDKKPSICPETHLTKAIILTLVCCWPFGIPAIINASGVSNAFYAGNYDLAVKKSNDAAKWCRISLIAGIIWWVIYAIIMIICAIVGAFDY